MSFRVNTQLEKVDKFVTIGDYEDALNLLENILNYKDIKENEKLVGYLFKANILNYLGNNNEALEIIENILKNLNKQKLSLMKFNFLIQKLFQI